MKRFVGGTCSQEEEKIVLEYLREHPAYLEQYCEQHPVLMEEQYNMPLENKKSEYILNRVYAGVFHKRKVRSKRLFWVVSMLAASILLFFFILKNEKGLPDTAPSQSISIAKITKVNTTSEIEHWILPDSSKVDALPGASITFLPQFTNHKREVYLKGEAVFTAQHDNSRSFVVICGDIATTALGTRFNVKEGPDKITVVLYEGKVIVRSNNRVDDNNNYCYLTAGMSTSFLKKQHKFITTSNFVKRQLTAKGEKVSKQSFGKAPHKVITLDNLTMQDALDKLALQYDVEIQYSPLDIQHMNIMAKIPIEQPVNHVLQNIARANGLDLLKLGDSAYLLRRIK